LRTKELRIAIVDSVVTNLSKEVNSFSLNVEDGIYFVNITDLETTSNFSKEIGCQQIIANS
jgi:hypothetical protein